MAPTQKIVSGTGHRPATAIRRARFAMEHGLLLPRCVVRLMDAIHPRDQKHARPVRCITRRGAARRPGRIGRGDARGRRSDIRLLATKLTLPVALGLVAVLCLVMAALVSIIPVPGSHHDSLR